jgi:hopene-associated glycosyltransferase HpnB
LPALDIIVACLSLAIWIYLLLARGSFWKEPLLPPDAGLSARATVVAVIPARNEAEGIARCIASLLRHGIDIILVDDASTDGTAQIATEAALAIGQAERLTILQGSPLPPGWTGKLWAMQQGIETARLRQPDFVLLTDADIEYDQGTVHELVGLAQSRNLDMVTRMVLLVSESFPERLLIPAFVFFFFMLYPPRWIANPRKSLAGAAGGCMLVRASTLFALDGVRSLRGELIDDCALAKAVKNAGGSIHLALTRRIRSLRGYATFGEIGRMIARTAYTQLQYSPVLLLGTLAGMVLTYLLPVWIAVAGRGWLQVLGIATWGLMTLAYLPMVRHFSQNLLWAFTLPVAGIFYTGATLYSAWAFYTGSGGRWKGRAQAYTQSSSPERTRTL